MAPTFILVRHGEAKHNVAYHEKGEKEFENEENRDAPLTEKGIEDARETARKLSQYTIVDIWCSPLTRTIQTAAEIFEETGASNAYLHDDLLERLGGKHVCNERKSKYELKEAYPYFDIRFLPDLPPYCIEREDLTALKYRMRSVILLLANIYKDLSETSHIVVVSHRDALYALTQKEFLKAEYKLFSLEELLEDPKKNLIENLETE